MEQGVEKESVHDQLRVVIRNGVVLIPTAFALGLIVAWGISKWAATPMGASFVAALGTGAVAWLSWTFHRTRGIM